MQRSLYIGFKALQWGVSELFSFFSVVKYPIAGYSFDQKELNGARMLYVGVKLSPGAPAPMAFMLCINKYGFSTAGLRSVSSGRGNKETFPPGD